MGDFKILVDEMKIRGFSRKTIKCYLHINNKFLEFIKKSAKDVNKSDVESYLVNLYDRNLSSATRHLVCAALKFYYESVMKRKFNLKFPKKSSKLSVVLEKEEILKMIDVTANLKHKLLLMLMYGSGLRVGEAIKSRVDDFDIQNKVFIVKSGKGAKDRYVNLSDKFIRCFLDFTKNKSGFLFESAYNAGHPISSRTASKIVENSLRKAKINKKAHCHTLRTSYATHLIENGIDISYVQKLLGHSNLSTTQAYIRLSSSSIRQVKSPLD